MIPIRACRLLVEVRDTVLDEGERTSVAAELRRAADLTDALQ